MIFFDAENILARNADIKTIRKVKINFSTHAHKFLVLMQRLYFYEQNKPMRFVLPLLVAIPFLANSQNQKRNYDTLPNVPDHWIKRYEFFKS